MAIMSPKFYVCVLSGFAVFFLVFWCSMWLLHLIAIVHGKYRLHHKATTLNAPYASVSVIKPLMGVDPHLVANLETFFTMNYPKFELLFCIEDRTDQAIAIVETLIAKYPTVEARLFVGGTVVGVNPKINNMHEAYEASKYEFILISDSGIRMKEDTLQDMMNHMTDKLALVHQMPFTTDREGFAATLEKIYFGTAQSRIYLAADFFHINCHTGMSALIRKSVLHEQGGLKTFGCYLAEDFFLAKSVTDRGWRIAICSQPALQNSGLCDVTNFQARLTRWAKLRVAMLPHIILFEPLSECLVIGGCAAWAVTVLFEWDALAFYLVHVLAWLVCDWILLGIVQNGSLPFNKFDFVVGWLFRECSGPYLFVHALLDPTIRWRSRVFKLAWGGVAQETTSGTRTTKS